MAQSKPRALLLRVDPTDGTPLFEQVGGQVKKAVAEGRAQWGGGKPAGSAGQVRTSKGSTVAEAVLEDRR